jgi:hypothetical protein
VGKEGILDSSAYMYGSVSGTADMGSVSVIAECKCQCRDLLIWGPLSGTADMGSVSVTAESKCQYRDLLI